jgi:hypothetical protein
MPQRTEQKRKAKRITQETRKHMLIHLHTHYFPVFRKDSKFRKI